MQYAPSVVQANTGWSRIQDLLKESPGVQDLPNAAQLPAFSKAIEFHNVDFSYDGKRGILANVNLRIPHGWNVAFVGGSGSGKSTALSLLMRFYDPGRGAVLMDGTPISQGTTESLRSQMGVVFQESLLFNTSIRENIRAGKRTASDAEIEDAAKAAEIHDAIMSMPENYNTIVGERGGKLSGGQRQRIAIARAMVRDPRILLLDEATSALDPATEALINATLKRLSSGRTVISVTHRLASITDADGIFVFSAGHMVECGRHEEMVGLGGAYAQLWEKQAGFSFGADSSHVSVSPDRLRAIPLLADLEPELLANLSRLCVAHNYRPEEDVFQQGDPGDKFYLIVRGRFQVIQRGRVVATLEDGDCFGEIALLTDQARNATVRAVNPSTCLAIGRAHFQELLRNSPTTQQRIGQLLQSRMTAGA
jgi:ATP-binding cassette subfamily B protein